MERGSPIWKQYMVRQEVTGIHLAQKGLMQKYDLYLSSCNTLISDFESASWGAAACLNKTMGSTKTNESDACR